MWSVIGDFSRSYIDKTFIKLGFEVRQPLLTPSGSRYREDWYHDEYWKCVHNLFDLPDDLHRGPLYLWYTMAEGHSNYEILAQVPGEFWERMFHLDTEIPVLPYDLRVIKTSVIFRS